MFRKQRGHFLYPAVVTKGRGDQRLLRKLNSFIPKAGSWR